MFSGGGSLDDVWDFQTTPTREEGDYSHAVHARCGEYSPISAVQSPYTYVCLSAESDQYKKNQLEANTRKPYRICKRALIQTPNVDHVTCGKVMGRYTKRKGMGL